MASAAYMRQWRAENQQRAREIDSRSKEKRKESVRAYHREWAARWRAANPEKARDRAARSREKHRDRLRQESRVRYYADVEKSRAYARAWQADKSQWIASIKLAAGCVDCGFKTHPHALQFDHLPQHEKKFAIGPAVASRSKESVLAEIAKCEVRCANCHAVKTALRRLNG